MRYSHIKVHRPRDVYEALRILEERRERVRIVAGATDVSVYIKDGVLKEDELLDITPLRRELSFIRLNNGWIEVGALTTYSSLLSSPLIHRHAPALAEAVNEIGSPMIRNLGTLAGNIGNASPAGDGIPPLYALGSRVVLESTRGSREVDIERFFLGVRRTVREPDEMITMVKIRPAPRGSYCFFKKLGLRAANAIAVVSVAGLLVPSSSSSPLRLREARIALGAVAPTVIRSPTAEKILLSQPLTEDVLWRVAEAAARDSKPITDVRGTAEYRRASVASLVYQALYEIVRGFRRPVGE